MALGQTLFALVLGIILVAAYGRDAINIYVPQLVVALALLWASTPAKRFDERSDLIEA